MPERPRCQIAEAVDPDADRGRRDHQPEKAVEDQQVGRGEMALVRLARARRLRVAQAELRVAQDLQHRGDDVAPRVLAVASGLRVHRPPVAHARHDLADRGERDREHEDHLDVHDRDELREHDPPLGQRRQVPQPGQDGAEDHRGHGE